MHACIHQKSGHPHLKSMVGVLSVEILCSVGILSVGFLSAGFFFVRWDFVHWGFVLAPL